MFANYPESEGSDLANISLPNDQDAMIEAVAAANPNTIVVLNTGGPVLMPWLTRSRACWRRGTRDRRTATRSPPSCSATSIPAAICTETFPTSLSAMPTASPSRFPGVDGQVQLLRGARCRLPLVRRPQRHAAVPVRLRPLLHELPIQPPDHDPAIVRQHRLGSGCPRRSGRAVGPRSPRGSPTPARSRAATWSSCTSVTRPRPGSHRASWRAFSGSRCRPTRSRTVSFTINGHELSYFSSAANGWTLPDGRFSVYVGDSSAPASLPLRGRLRRHQDDWVALRAR